MFRGIKKNHRFVVYDSHSLCDTAASPEFFTPLNGTFRQSVMYARRGFRGTGLQLPRAEVSGLDEN